MNIILMALKWMGLRHEYSYSIVLVVIFQNPPISGHSRLHFEQPSSLGTSVNNYSYSLWPLAAVAGEWNSLLLSCLFFPISPFKAWNFLDSSCSTTKTTECKWKCCLGTHLVCSLCSAVATSTPATEVQGPAPAINLKIRELAEVSLYLKYKFSVKGVWLAVSCSRTLRTL